jgi:hypothetical protein
MDPHYATFKLPVMITRRGVLAPRYRRQHANLSQGELETFTLSRKHTNLKLAVQISDADRSLRVLVRS